MTRRLYPCDRFSTEQHKELLLNVTNTTTSAVAKGVVFANLNVPVKKLIHYSCNYDSYRTPAATVTIKCCNKLECSVKFNK